MRSKLTREDGTTWSFGYNDRSEVVANDKKLSDGTLAAGQPFRYTYDGIGNRTEAKSGGDSSGAGLRTVAYTPNALNQYEEIETPGSFDVLTRSVDTVGVAASGASASVTRQGNLHRAEVSGVANANGAWVDLEVTSPAGTGTPGEGSHWVPQADFVPEYDANGNLTKDGRWDHVWDGENRLVSMTVSQSAATAGAPRLKLEFAYDHLGRRIRKKVSTTTAPTIAGASWTTTSDSRFAYDGWNLVGEFQYASSTLAVRKTYLWGMDISGTAQGAGGVGGLLAVNTVAPATSVCYPAYDGNGNIIAWQDSGGAALQRIDYDPFGKVLTREGDPAFSAPAFGFSTKYEDRETRLLYYGYRYYNPVASRWPSRDPIEEEGGVNLYGFVRNRSIGKIDVLGSMEYPPHDYPEEYKRKIEEEKEERENLASRRRRAEETRVKRRNNASCCDQPKIDDGGKDLNKQYSEIKSRLRGDGIIGSGKYFNENPNSSCLEQATAVMGGFKIPDCWDCKLVNAGNYPLGAENHWWVECTAFGKDGKDVKTLIFDAYHDRPGGPNPLDNRKTYNWEQTVSDEDFTRCEPDYLNPGGCKIP